MKDTDGPRTEPDRFGRDDVELRAGARRGRGSADLGVPQSILRDAGAVAADGIAERPVAWTLIAGGIAVQFWVRSREVAYAWPSAWLLAAVLVAAVACGAVARERRGLPLLFASLTALAAVVGKGTDPTAVLSVAGAGAIAATLLLHGSPRALRLAGGTALALGCTFALWRAGWRVGKSGWTGALDFGAFRLAGFRQEAVIAAGVAMLTPVVRPRVAAGVIVVAALVVAIDYVALEDRPVAHFNEALLVCGAVSVCASAVRMSSAPGADGAEASGRLAARLQRAASFVAFVAGCVLIENTLWTSGLYHNPTDPDLAGDEPVLRGAAFRWSAVIGVGGGCLTALCARLRPRGAVTRWIAAFAVASLIVAAGAWAAPGPGNPRFSALLSALLSALWTVPSVLLFAALAVHAPAWSRRTLTAGIAVATLAAVAHTVRTELSDPWIAPWTGPRFVYLAVFVWGAIGVLAASLPLRASAVAAIFFAAVLTTEVVTLSVLAVASDGDIPFAPNWGDMARAWAYSLCWILILRPLCARSPVPEEHPIHRDFDLLGRAT